MKGPFAIVFRGRSGSRLLCEAFLQNDIWMGICDNKTRDSAELAYHRKAVKRLVKAAFRYPDMTPPEKEHVREKMRMLVEELKNNCPAPETKFAYGWKRAIGTFLVEIFLDAYPEGKVIHMIRDGRDVMLSRLRRVEDLDDPIVKQMVFDEANVPQYQGRRLSDRVLEEHRNEIEMRHWVTSVRFGMRGRKYKNQYKEVFYEDLCQQPAQTLSKVFEFLEVPLCSQTKQWILATVSTQRIGKWQRCDAQVEDAIKIGEPLLKDLDYVWRL